MENKKIFVISGPRSLDTHTSMFGKICFKCFTYDSFKILFFNSQIDFTKKNFSKAV